MNCSTKVRFVLFMGLTSFTGLVSGQTFTPAKTFGEENLVMDFFCSEVTYPEIALEQETEGTVILSFQVNETGQVQNLTVKQSVSPEIDAEAIRVFNMLIWEPAVKLGNPVVSANEFPIRFDIKKYQKHCKARGYSKTEYPFQPVDTSGLVYEATHLDKSPYAVFSEKGMSLGKFINQNIRYPETAYRQSISGKVILRFIIEPHGRISNIKVVQPVSGGCTQEAIRLLQMIKWMPGIHNKMAVRSITNLEINFNLPEDSDLKMIDHNMNSN